jgi:hypothetical protein
MPCMHKAFRLEILRYLLSSGELRAKTRTPRGERDKHRVSVTGHGPSDRYVQ